MSPCFLRPNEYDVLTVIQDVESTISAQDNQLFMNHDDDAFLNELIQGIGGRMTGNNARFSGSGWQRLEDVKTQIRHAQTLLKNRQVRENVCIAPLRTLIRPNDFFNYRNPFNI